MLPSSTSPCGLSSIKRLSCIWLSAQRRASVPRSQLAVPLRMHRPGIWSILPVAESDVLLSWGDTARQRLNDV